METKLGIRMALGGRAWRGYFRVGDELTSGKPDQKEGLYFGAELPADDPRVLAGTPLHGPNLFPARPEGLREAVLEYMAALTGLGHRLVAGLALSLGLEESYFADHGTREPLTLFRIFNYPPPADPSLWGVGEHTDYGLLTILLQDDAGGLEVKSRSRWVPAPPVPGSFVCNIGDMLDRMTGGLYRSTPHRVRNPAPATGSPSRSSSTRTSSRPSGRSSSRVGDARPTTGTSGGTARVSTRFRVPTVLTCWARSAKSSPSCARRSFDIRSGPMNLDDIPPCRTGVNSSTSRAAGARTDLSRESEVLRLDSSGAASSRTSFGPDSGRSWPIAFEPEAKGRKPSAGPAGTRATEADPLRRGLQRVRLGRYGPRRGPNVPFSRIGSPAMKKLINRPEQVVAEMVEGLAAAFPGLRRLPGHHVLVRDDAEEARRGRVALVSGGGSGHEPAHAGYVGRGMLSAAVAGDVFTSPAPDAVLAAIRAVAGPPGCLLIVKNYTGDRLNFGLAAEMARAEGIPVEVAVVADDAALAESADHAGRRGLAGTVLVHKVAGAAAEAGADLRTVAAEARAAAEAVRTMGVALSPCTVPAAGRPGFELAGDEVELGLGIHGEPGVRRAPIEPADRLVDRLLDAISADLGLAAGDRVALLVNGLGGTPAMELAVVARRAIAGLEGRGVVVGRAYVGEFLTALEMAGVSLSVLRLDDARLARLDATTDAPAWPNAAARPRAGGVVAPGLEPEPARAEPRRRVPRRRRRAGPSRRPCSGPPGR